MSTWFRSGEAAIRREGADVTIVATGWTVGRALAAAETLAAEGIEVEVIDPRTLNPLDMATILTSVQKTGHVVLVDQATPHAAFSNVIAAEIADEGFSSLKAPIKQVTVAGRDRALQRADGGVRPSQRDEDRPGGPPGHRPCAGSGLSRGWHRRRPSRPPARRSPCSARCGGFAALRSVWRRSSAACRSTA